MSARLLNGREVSRVMREKLGTQAQQYSRDFGRRPVLATVLVGDDPASHTYVRMKAAACTEVGIESRRVHLDAGLSTNAVCAEVRALSEDPNVDGILLQHPVPPGVDERAAFDAIDPAKDVDGVTRDSFAAMALGTAGFESATPGGIMRLLDSYAIALSGRHAVVIGRSPILGRPMGMLLLARDATVTYCHSRTADLSSHVESADLVVAAVGSPGLVRGEWIKPGAVVIDAGYADDKGDVDFDSASRKASYITPVPGGVGPMTITTLLEQTVRAARERSMS
ncbi:bifunctional 5,10-methylenetetrahydrofolate dehydrogenase/5,10-methenyltetrahydrofolate cyclohydrolase [Rhodococcus jostii]|uniref:Bifunctional protein FolD n=1 Tax=Rhodococcus jostii TaxID=132919 RepID=A0ABU4CR45_RHOJO|nr:bifunctional 5,10-methylenetetrahydrofolate dehydrogenase/5,10-methenyltetrahydrofolate cyclohydrolase [Rhodococcus jostii]MDV6286047.1 bifunctional 5,10-methylenetetrahydrofolate dehydrogenase/5,10-methenyltetrahydrofolate cyclohydrolase [Rhodococcus jostii]